MISGLVSLTGIVMAGPRTAMGLLGALTALPRMATQLERIGEATACLPELERHMRSVSEDTQRLNELHIVLDDVRTHTRQLHAVEEATTDIRGAMPVLIGLQDELPAIVPMLQELQTPMQRLSVSLAGLEETTDRLAQATRPLGRLAERFPGRSNNGK